jgi:hypothetical protein
MNNAAKLLKDSKSARWIVLGCLVIPMFASYFFDDMFSTLSHIFKSPELLSLGWNSQDYGFYAGGYSFLCVWGGLIMGRAFYRLSFCGYDGWRRSIGSLCNLRKLCPKCFLFLVG